MAERLRDATSPYLLQHADNPVDWWPWGDAAFAAAAERDVPVLLSVGYSACHWCHVMAHESFEDPETAALLNEQVISIKVDREERPDVDAVYMMATQLMTGQGGWPMTVFMTPDREPFFCGTYFPRAQLRQLVLRVAQVWREDRSAVAGQARQIAAALAERAAPSPASFAAESDGEMSTAGAGPAEAGRDAGGADLAGRDVIGGDLADPAETASVGTGTAPRSVLAAACEVAVRELAREFDADRGGFGGAPKFPPSMVLEFLLRHSERNTGPGGLQALAMAEATAAAMARGGMYDQLAGGFARYSVDAGWVVPHFEKMLYDNALLARVFAHLWRRTGSELARRIATQTCDWLISELRTAGGGFAAALDADSDGAEGAFYVWTPDQLTEVLGAADGGYAAAVFGVTQTGTFEHGASVLQLRADPADDDRFTRIRRELLAARALRPRPARDDKVVAAWNGLAIAALADAGPTLRRPDFTAAAIAAAEFVERVHLSGGRLARTSLAGRASGTAGVLDDYGCVASGLLVLASAAGPDDASVGGSAAASGRWLAIAGDLLETVLARFGTGSGGFYDTADDGEQLIYRPSEVADGPSPSGTFAAADALLSFSALTGSLRHRDAAVAGLASVPALAGRFPRAVGAGLSVAEAAVSGPAEIAIVGPAGPARDELHAAALTAASPGAVIAVGDGRSAPVPLLEGKEPVAGQPAAYVCRNLSCRAPVTTAEDLRAALRA
jgi:uncharacterized protein